MCGRFEVGIPKEKLIQKFGVNHWQMDNYTRRYNIPPGTDIPVIRQEGNERFLIPAHWGLIPSWSKDKKIAYKTINARFETIAEKPSFRSAYKHRRCLIPASAYYEWKKLADRKQPFRIGRNDNEPFAMAGLFEDWTDTETGESIKSCTIITRPAYEKLAHIHSRMPVILPEEIYDLWLQCEFGQFDTVAMNELMYYPISSDVGSPGNDYLFKPLPG